MEAVRPSRGPGEGPQARLPRLARGGGPAGLLPWPAGLFARVVLPEPVRPFVRAVCDSAGSGFKLGSSAAKLAAGLPGALTRMARPLTLQRWGTDDADGVPTDPGVMGY